MGGGQLDSTEFLAGSLWEEQGGLDRVRGRRFGAWFGPIGEFHACLMTWLRIKAPLLNACG